VGGISKNARFLHRSGSLGTVRHRTGLVERCQRLGFQIKFRPLLLNHTGNSPPDLKKARLEASR
jgi:hypothetical protein